MLQQVSLSSPLDIGTFAHRDVFTALLGAINRATLPDRLWELASMADHSGASH